jgi:DNA-binding transcriptional ArsR family regulator
LGPPDQIARIGKALGVEARVRIVQLLRERGLCVGALAARLDITQGAVSQHLRILRDAGLVTADRRGCYVHYTINAETLAQWRRALDELLRRPASGSHGGTPCVGKKAATAPGRRT